MKVKKFTGKNIQEIYQQIKLEMGKDAVILHTKKQKTGGFLGFFTKEFYEVTAAVEEFNYDDEETIEEKKEIMQKQEEKINNVNQQINISPVLEENEKIETEEKSPVSSDLIEMQKKMDEMMSLIESGNISFKGEFKKIYDRLTEQEVEARVAARILKKVEKKYYDNNTSGDIYALLKEEIFRIIKKSSPIDNQSKNKQTVVALVGPTGVGKTTTISKLAANYTIIDKKKVALLTVDTYRIAAVEQLKTVGEIIGVPVEVVFTPRNLRNAIQSNADKELIFIDTAGRSHKNSIQMSEIKAFLEAASPDDIFLVLSACTKYKDMLDIIEKYESLNIKKIIFTKLDETTTYGAILNVVDKSKKYLSYFTTGQSVPDDIETADQEKYFNLLIGDLKNE
jgi:flagellar biosynthesis protein FlhF